MERFFDPALLLLYMRWDEKMIESVSKKELQNSLPWLTLTTSNLLNSLEGLEATACITFLRSSNLDNVVRINCSKSREGAVVINVYDLALNTFVFKCSDERRVTWWHFLLFTRIRIRIRMPAPWWFYYEVSSLHGGGGLIFEMLHYHYILFVALDLEQFSGLFSSCTPERRANWIASGLSTYHT